MSMPTSAQFDRIRNQVTINAFAIICGRETVARVRVVRPCRLRTGMERFSALVETWQGGSYNAAIGRAGGCGYDKVAAAQADAIRQLGFDGHKANCSRQFAAPAIAEGLGLPAGSWQTVELV